MDFLSFFLILRTKTYKMNTIEVSNVEILEVDSNYVKEQSSVICIEQNGFLLCKSGNITLMMDDIYIM